MIRSLAATLFALVTLSAAGQPLTKSAIQVDPGDTKLTGATFAYRLTYTCGNTSGPCLGASVEDLLPAEVQFISTVPASPTGDVAAINITPNSGGSGRTLVQFVMINPLPAGNSGDLVINVRFPVGSTPDGTTATNTAVASNLGASPGAFTTPPVTVTAVATVQVNLQKTLLTSPANLDMPESYRLSISNLNTNGALNLTSIGPVTDTLPAGTVFNGSTPAADCQPGCVGTTPATVSWSAPCAVPLTPGQSCNITVNVTFPSATFPSGTNVTNSFTADATPLGEPSQTFGPANLSHPVTTFVATPGASIQKNITGNSPNPPALNQTFSYEFPLSNSGNVPLDNLVLIDTLPVEMQVLSVTTGSYTGLTNFAAGEGVRVSYEKNTALGVFTLWGSSPGTATNTLLTAPPPGLGAGEYITRIRWEYGQAAPGMAASPARPTITGRIINPDNAGGPVAVGDTIQNCVSLSAVYTAGPTNVNHNICRLFNLSGPFVQLSPAKENLSGGGPFNPGQIVAWRLRVRSDPRSSDPVPLEDLVATDLLPVDLTFSTWTFDDQGTGLPAPQSFDQIPNFAGTGRTLLRWRWNAGSGNLGVNQQVWINITTNVRHGAPAGSLSNDFTLESDAPSLEQRCTGSSTTDALDLDEDGDVSETLCRTTGTISVASIAQLISSKTVQGTCDASSVSNSAGTLTGGAITYTMRVQNAGTVALQNLVLIDILPFVGDTGVRDTNPRGSMWEPLFAAPIVSPPGTVVYYSTSGNPCRGEVGGPTTSCDPPNWTTVAPSPITSVRSFKIAFGSRVVNPYDFVEFTFTMATPAGVPAGATAYNSFAFQADRADGLGSLAAEPQKIGIAPGSCESASIGDFVWVDTNGDGSQNDGPTGLNGVHVTLLTTGADTIAGNADDVPLSTTITSLSPSAQPGWYSFPGLAAGSYYVHVTRPPTFLFTPADVTTDASDSDIQALTGNSHVVTLDPAEDDATVDAGLIATPSAAAGDFAWFDRNGNGLQDEPVSDGANGVTVRLFADDGDAVFDAGDAPAGTTVTSDDPFGRPGYYLFEGLTPGVRYFVQFALPASATAFTTADSGGDDLVDSDAGAAGVSAGFILAPGEINTTIDAGLVTATGTMALGDQIWSESDNDGFFEPQNGETGVDGVRVDLYLDTNADSAPAADEYAGTTFSTTSSGFSGRYRFSNLAPGTYIVVIHPANFTGGGPLAGLASTTGADPATDPDDDLNGDDNGANFGALVASRPVTLTDNGEPTSEDGNNDTNLTVDFGFAAIASPQFDYGDAPDIASGTGPGNYQTTALDSGASHRIDVSGSPYLGSGVDSDDGTQQDDAALLDDATPGNSTLGIAGDDENGVVVPASVTPGATATFTLTAGSPSPCLVDAWVDWNRDGDFTDAGEQIAASTVVSSVPAVLSPAVPSGATAGVTYARFRCSSSGGLSPAGPAGDGEIEDYALVITGMDFGDAPASYSTQGAGAAAHLVGSADPLLLGTCVDTESDGQPDVAALGDDIAAGTSRIGNCFDDEDGISFLTTSTACQTTQISAFVSGSGSAVLDAWIDFNANGSFNDTGERIFAAQSVTAGANPLSFPVPCTAVTGGTYARFRLSSAGVPAPGGQAPDGEVEDYAVAIGGVDFGDAPDSYATLISSGGAHHTVTSGFSLGATIDTEPDGQPNVSATGDTLDEDGVSLPPSFVACSAANVSVTLTNTAALSTPRLDAWIDFDGDGTFNDPRDRIATSLALVSGANNVPVNVPCDARSSASYGRFRLSSGGIATPGGFGSQGEVEDYAALVLGLDFGDAPDPTYPTRLASNGARHIALAAGNPTFGVAADTEPDGQAGAGATGDDASSTDDEDGVTFSGVMSPGGTMTMHLAAGATGGFASCWIDYNRDGDWNDGGEMVVNGTSLAANTTSAVPLTVPLSAVTGTTYARCRIATTAISSPTGSASNGEVEDHSLLLITEEPMIGIAKRLVSNVPSGGPAPGPYTLTFELVIENLGNVPLANVNATENLAALFPAPRTYSVTSLTSSTFTVNPAFNGSTDTNLLAAGNTLAAGASGAITLVLSVTPADDYGPYSNSSEATATSPSGASVSDVSQNGADPDPDGDDDSTNDDEPTTFSFAAPVPIPTAGEWALLTLMLLLGAAAMTRMRT